MPFCVPRRTLAVLSVAALLAAGSPGVAAAKPSREVKEPRGFIQQLLDAAAWARTLLPLWEEDGNGFDPHGNPPRPTGACTVDCGPEIDPNG